MHQYQQIGVLITHYNRSKSLERLLSSLIQLNLAFNEIVVSDDGSQPVHLKELERLQAIYHFKLVTTPTNKGLGNNINKGQDAITSKYTLYIQEDFVPTEAFSEKLQHANAYLESDSSLDMVRFYAYTKYPNLVPLQHGFSEMRFNQAYFWEGYQKFYLYSDHPHIRRSNFFEKFGKYQEGLNPERTEYYMMMQVLKVGAKVYFYEDHQSLFIQENSAEEPSTLKRNFWRNNDTIFINGLRHLYRYLRFNFDLLYLKVKS